MTNYMTKAAPDWGDAVPDRVSVRCTSGPVHTTTDTDRVC